MKIIDYTAPSCPIHSSTRMLPSPGYEVELMCVACKREIEELKEDNEPFNQLVEYVRSGDSTPFSFKGDSGLPTS